MRERKNIPEKIRTLIMNKSNNSCCICQHPCIVVHHMDQNPSNNELDNLIPLCPNHHDQAHKKGGLSTNLTIKRLKELRDKWYEYCEKRKEGFQDYSIGKLKLKNMVRDVGLPVDGWAKTFSSVNEEYAGYNKDSIIDALFSTTNPDHIKTYLHTVYIMFRNHHDHEPFIRKFKDVCNSFGFEFEEIIQ